MARKQAIDYAVVGSGVAGCYVAWRLANHASLPTSEGPRPSIALYEMGVREGGRLLSAEVPGAPFRAELGGMRFVSSQILISSLTEELGLSTTPFEFGAPQYYIRGTYFDEILDAPHNVKEELKGLNPEQLICHAIRSALGELELPPATGSDTSSLEAKLNGIATDSMPLSFKSLFPDEWRTIQREARLMGRPLYSVGWWNLLHHYLRSEAYALAHDAFGYQSIVANWNAGEAIPWFLREFGGDSFHTLQGGMVRIPATLCFMFQNRYPRGFHASHKLARVSAIHKSDEYMLGFENGSEVRAKHVILALPQQALEEIQLEGFDEAAVSRFRAATSSVSAHALFKLFLGYEKAWWASDWALLGQSDRKVTFGQSGRKVTDLPVRQVYFWGPDKAYEATEMGVAMASYSDGRFLEFWRPLHRGSAPTNNEYWFTKDVAELSEDEKGVLESHGAPEPMKRKAHAQLLELFNVGDKHNIPDPYVALEKEWARGWHTWNAHHKPWVERDTLEMPFPHIYVCGEAYSSEQGWIEGALRSSERVLERLGVAQPRWVSDKSIRDSGFDSFVQYVRF